MSEVFIADIDENTLHPIFGYEGYFLSDGNCVYKKINTTIKVHGKFVVLRLNGQYHRIRYADIIFQSQPLPANGLTPINGFDGYYLDSEGNISRGGYRKLKINRMNGTGPERVMLIRAGKKHKIHLNELIRRKYLYTKIEGAETLIGFPDYILDRKGNIYNLNGKKLHVDKWGCVYVNQGGIAYGVVRTVINAQLSGLLKRCKRVNEFPEYFIDDDGNIYNKNFRPIKPTVWRDNANQRVAYQIFFWEGKKSVVRSWARIIADNLLPLPPDDSAYCIGYRDGNPMNCTPENVYWVTKSEYGKRLSKIRSDKFALTKDEAINRTECPILKRYYETGDIGLIDEEFRKFESTRKKPERWLNAKGEIYDIIMRKLSNYSLIAPIEKYMGTLLRFYNNDGTPKLRRRELEKMRITSYEVSEWAKPKVDRYVHRKTVDDLEYASAI